jgi:Kef-type K+ transport system membrane component KefB/mannitol/fructose-specific phosphotransferase system IIA component
MDTLSPREITGMFLALGVMLFCARLLGEISRRAGQPAVIGEILAGILLGATGLGTLAPDLFAFLFPATGGGAYVLQGLTTLSIALFLLVAGLEIDLSTVWRQGKTAAAVALFGMALPFALGFCAAWFLPGTFGFEPGTHRLAYALFLATALSISALPIIAKILMDLRIYRSDLGVTVVAAAVLNDLAGWLVFAMILGLLGTGHGNGLSLGVTVGTTLAFTAAMLTVVPWLMHRILPWIQAYTSWPGGVLGFALSLALFSAAFTEWLGVHAIFGAFLAGVAVGHSSHLRERTRTTIDQFISFFFAPLFFASIGLRIDFASHFDPKLTLMIFFIAVIGKVLGSLLGGRLGGVPWREAWGIGFGMSAQGTMGIILGVLALQVGLISQRLFVSLVVIALATSLLSGPMMQRILRLKRPRRFIDFLDSGRFIRCLSSTNRTDAIGELAAIAADGARLDRELVTEAVLARERIMATGLGNGVAAPHARLPGLGGPVVAVGLSPSGIDFDAPDGKPAHILCLILTPREDDGAQLEILSDLASTFYKGTMVEQALTVEGMTGFLALVRSGRD